MTMTLSQRAIEAAARAIYDKCGVYPNYTLRQVNDLLASELVNVALSAALAVDGLCLVPVEPSDTMIEAGDDALDASYEDQEKQTKGELIIWSHSQSIYLAMIAAANDGEDSAPAGTEG